MKPAKTIDKKRLLVRASGKTLPRSSETDFIDFIIDNLGEATAVICDFRAGIGAAALDRAHFCVELREQLRAKIPLYSVGAALSSLVPEGASVGLCLVRISQVQARVEVLNAGMPPIASLLATGRISFHPPLSAALGLQKNRIHPYEWLGLEWGSTWLLSSDGSTRGSTSLKAITALCQELDLARYTYNQEYLGTDIAIPARNEGDGDDAGDASTVILSVGMPKHLSRTDSGSWPPRAI